MTTMSLVAEGFPLISAIEAGLRNVCKIVPTGDGVRVTTHCMYPSNGLVRVTVRAGVSSIVASDEGEGLGEALSAGVIIENPDKLMRGFVSQRGLILRNGVISTPVTPIDAAPVAILHVANAAKEAAGWLYEHGGVKRRRNFRELLSAFLVESFREHISERRILGASHKAHRFQNVIAFSNGKQFIVDAVANEASSINARVVANLDVKASNNPSIEQRIVYDDEENWSSADLKLLQVGATIVPFSRARQIINRIAEETRVSA